MTIAQNILIEIFISNFQTRITSQIGDYGRIVPHWSIPVRCPNPWEMATRQMRYLVSKSPIISCSSCGCSICTLPWHFRNGNAKTKRFGPPMSHSISHPRLRKSSKYRIEKNCDKIFALLKEFLGNQQSFFRDLFIVALFLEFMRVFGPAPTIIKISVDFFEIL